MVPLDRLVRSDSWRLACLAATRRSFGLACDPFPAARLPVPPAPVGPPPPGPSASKQICLRMPSGPARRCARTELASLFSPCGVTLCESDSPFTTLLTDCLTVSCPCLCRALAAGDGPWALASHGTLHTSSTPNGPVLLSGPIQPTWQFVESRVSDHVAHCCVPADMFRCDSFSPRRRANCESGEPVGAEFVTEHTSIHALPVRPGTRGRTRCY